MTRLHKWLTVTANVMRSLLGSRREFLRGIALILSAAPIMASAYLVLVVLLSTLPLFQVWLTKLIVDTITQGAGGYTQSARLAMLYALTLIISAGLQPVQQELASWLEDHTVSEVDRRLMQAGTRLRDLFRIERPEFGDELRLLGESTYYIPRLFPQLQRGPGALLTIVGLLSLLARLHPLLPIVFSTFR